MSENGTTYERIDWSKNPNGDTQHPQSYSLQEMVEATKERVAKDPSRANRFGARRAARIGLIQL